MGKLFAKVKRWIFARYEAAIRTIDRSWPWSTYQDARFDVDKATRETIQSRHRELICNNGICLRIRSLFLQFSVGVCGLNCIPNSKDEDWNVSRKTSFDLWSEAPFIDSELSLGQGTMQWAGALFDDGEPFIHLTSDRVGGRVVPRLATYEAHRCFTPPDKTKEEGKTICDGVRVNEFGKPIGYYIQDGPDKTQLKLIPIFDPLFPERGGMIHIYKARRPGMLRGLPEGYAVMNILQDLAELQKLQMDKAKSQAVVTHIIHNASGEADASQFRRSRMQLDSTNATGASVTKDASAFYDDQIKAYRLHLKTGEEAKRFPQDDPSVVVQQYWEFLISLICVGYNTPKLLVFPYSMQGTVVRFDVDICSTSFRANFELIAQALRWIYRWQTAWALKMDRSMDSEEPEDALSVVIEPPRPPNADLGYNAQALETELRLGTRTYQDVYAERQQDWRHQIRQIAEFESEVDKLAKEFKISSDRIAKKLDQQEAIPETKASGAIDFESLKQEFDSYGVGVRAGVLTPNPTDENYFRAKAGLPPMTPEAQTAWSEEDNVRRPITLTPPGGEPAAVLPGAAPAEGDPQEA